MDENVIRMLLEQNVKTVQSFVQILFNTVTKDIDKIKEDNIELKRSLEFTQAENDTLKQTVSQLQSAVRKIEEHSISQGIGERLRKIEDDKRSKNLRVTGVTEEVNENREQSEQKVRKIIRENLGLKDIQLSEAYRVGKIDSRSTNKPRPIIAKVASRQQKINCLKESKKLKGTSVFITEDVSKATQDIRNSKFDLLKRKRDEGMIAYFSGANLICKARTQQRIISNLRGDGSVIEDGTQSDDDQSQADRGAPQHGGRGAASPQGDREDQTRQAPQSPVANDVGSGAQPSDQGVGVNLRPKRSTAGKSNK